MAWWALAAALPIVLLYVLKVRQRRLRVPTILFWSQVFEERKPRTLFHRLRHWLSLLAQIALLLLLAAALADPIAEGAAFRPRRTVLVIDRSASMSAVDGESGASRLDEAKRVALDRIDAMRHFDTMAVVSAAADPVVIVGMTGHPRTLREAVESIPPTDEPTRLVRGIDLARRLLAGDGLGEIVVVTDGADAGLAALEPSDDLRLIRVGGPAENTGITRLEARRSAADPLGYELLATVEHFGAAPIDTRLNIYLNDRIIDVLPIRLAPGEVFSRVLEKTDPAGGRLRAELQAADALTADNRAHAILPPRPVIPVTLESGGNLFLRGVLTAMNRVELRVSGEEPVGVESAAEVEQDPELRTAPVTVFHRTVPDRLPAGSVLVIDPRGATDLWLLGPEIESPMVAHQEKGSPLLSHVRLDNVQVPGARAIEPIGPHTVLASAVNGEAIAAAFDRPQGRVVVLSADLDQSDLPLRTAFPILIGNALAWFTGSGGEIEPTVATGGSATVEVGREGEAVSIVDPLGSAVERPAGGGAVSIGPFPSAGVWKVSRGGQTREVAVNLSDRRESDLGADPSVERWAAGRAGELEGGRPIWFYLLLAAVALLALEWWAYQRRWIT